MLANLTAQQMQIGLKVLEAFKIPLPLISTVIAAVNSNTLLLEDGTVNETQVEELLRQVVPLLPWNNPQRSEAAPSGRLFACKCCMTINKVK